MAKNPFVYEEYAMGERFCGREKEIAVITDYIDNGKNILLYSRRRFGKSSLIQEVFHYHIDPKTTIAAYIDLFEILNANDFARLFYAGIAEAMGFTLKSAVKHLMRYFRKVSFNVSVSSSGKISYTPSFGSRDFDELIEDAISGIAQYAKERDKKVVIALDEFQQIAQIKEKRIDAVLRKYMQRHGELAFIFAGSREHLLTSLFTRQSAPLYQMASGLHLEEIDPETFYAFANEKLGGHLERPAFDRLYALAQGEAKLIQHVCYHLYPPRGKQIGEDAVSAALTRILKESDGEHRMLMERLSTPQRSVLKAIAIGGGRGVYAKETLFELNMTKASMTSALKTLIKEEIVRQEEERYSINGRKFELWCRRHFGAAL